jgi:hypothetical protein
MSERPRRIFDLLTQFPPLLSYLWTFSIYAMIFFMVYMIFKRVRAMNNRRTLVFWKDGTHSLQSYRVEDGKLMIRKAGALGDNSKEWTPRVISDNVIPAKQSFRNKVFPLGFKQRDLFIAVEDSPELVSLRGLSQDIQDGAIDESLLLKTWTKPEIAQFIKKALAKGIVQRKVFSDQQFYMFFMILILNLMCNVMIIRALGIF